MWRHDAEGKRLTPSHAVKRGKRYRYYVSHSLITDPGASPVVTASRLPAVELERLVLNQVCDVLDDQSRIWALLGSVKLSNHSARSALRQGGKLAQDLPQFDSGAVLRRLLRKVVVHDDRVDNEISVKELINKLFQGRRLGADDHQDGSLDGESTVVVTSTCWPVRRGIEMRLVIEGRPGSNEYRPDSILIAALVKAHVWWGELCVGRARTIKEIAVREKSDECYVARILKLAFLAPDCRHSRRAAATASHCRYSDQDVVPTLLFGLQCLRLGFVRPG